MSLTQSLTQLLVPAIENAGYFLEELRVSNPGKHCILTCVIDGPKPLNLDEITLLSGLISELLDQRPLIEGTFTLEVTSPGVDRPLTQPRHWEKNLTRIIAMVFHDGGTLTARLTHLGEGDATFVENIRGRMKTHTVILADIKRAQVQVEFSRKDEK